MRMHRMHAQRARAYRHGDGVMKHELPASEIIYIHVINESPIQDLSVSILISINPRSSVTMA